MENKFLIDDILDKYNRYLKNGRGISTNFLNIKELNIVKKVLDNKKINYNIYILNEYQEKYIIYFGDYNDYVTIYKFKNNNLSHKDVLGTLFSIGYNSSIIGDIFVEEDVIYITNLTRLNTYLENNLVIIKNNYIELEKTNEINLKEDRFIIFKIIIPSYRLDAIVSKLANTSREKSNNLIKDKLVLVNYEEITNTSKIINIGDIISIRKVGKFIINKEISKSKKDNYFIEVKKYN